MAFERVGPWRQRAVFTWLAAVGAFIYTATFPLSLPRVVGGLFLGAALLCATAIAMFPDPAVFARVLGCL